MARGKGIEDKLRCGAYLWVQRLELINLCDMPIVAYTWIISLQVFPREQLYVFRMEDLDVRSSSSSEMTHDDIEGSKAAKRRELSKVFDFLGVEEPNTESWELIADHKVSNKIQSIGSMLPETKILLREFYAPFNEKLSTLLGDKKFLWDDVH